MACDGLADSCPEARGEMGRQGSGGRRRDVLDTFRASDTMNEEELTPQASPRKRNALLLAIAIGLYAACMAFLAYQAWVG